MELHTESTVPQPYICIVGLVSAAQVPRQRRIASRERARILIHDELGMLPPFGVVTTGLWCRKLQYGDASAIGSYGNVKAKRSDGPTTDGVFAKQAAVLGKVILPFLVSRQGLHAIAYMVEDQACRGDAVAL